MSNFLIDELGNQIWYDLKSAVFTKNIWYRVDPKNEPTVYVRPHRTDGPAVIQSDGKEKYFLKGELHREDGPALINSETVVYWCLNGAFYTFDNWCSKAELNQPVELITYLKLKYGKN